MPGELKPCPFCGERQLRTEQAETDGYFIVCEICEAEGPFSWVEATAIASWNARPAEPGAEPGGKR